MFNWSPVHLWKQGYDGIDFNNDFLPVVGGNKRTVNVNICYVAVMQRPSLILFKKWGGKHILHVHILFIEIIPVQ